jgi:5-oxoprolinase (ATP-hydrolysing) subunit A
MIAVAGGRKITIAADSICLHGDNQSAVKFARRLRTELATAGVTVRSFIS